MPVPTDNCTPSSNLSHSRPKRGSGGFSLLHHARNGTDIFFGIARSATVTGARGSFAEGFGSSRKGLRSMIVCAGRAACGTREVTKEATMKQLCFEWIVPIRGVNSGLLESCDTR